MILVPVKNLVNAKQRLAGMLDQQTRTELAQCMLRDVLQAISAYGRSKIAVVTSDAFACELAGCFGFEVICDESNISETDAIETATRVCEARGVVNTVVIPGDVPLIEAEDLESIFKHAPQTGSVLVPAADRRGTNAALRSPAGLFPLRFGNDSFWPHLSTAVAANLPCVVLPLPRVALDVDTPEDLRNLAKAPGEKPSQQFARELIRRINQRRTVSAMQEAAE